MILFILIDVAFVIWATFGEPWWMYIINVVLVYIAMCFWADATIRGRRLSKFCWARKLIAVSLALVAFRRKLLVYFIWVALKIVEDLFLPWGKPFIKQTN